jgi:hypothetical protein
MNELTKDGVWAYRKDEYTPVEFLKLNTQQQESYVQQIQYIPVEDRSTYERVILHRFGNDLPVQKYKFITLSQEIVIPNPVEIIVDEEEVELISKLSTQDIRKYLDEFFIDYPKWEWDLGQTTFIKFVDAITNVMDVDSLSISYIKSYLNKK